MKKKLEVYIEGEKLTPIQARIVQTALFLGMQYVPSHDEKDKTKALTEADTTCTITYSLKTNCRTL